MEISEKTMALLQALQDKYKLEQQDMEGYLEGLLYNQYLDYWDYIHVEALLNLQHPRTNVPDEMIFIMYHQITELYFKLTLWEIDQIVNHANLTGIFFRERLKRMNNYFRNLTNSFEIMTTGMEVEQFLKFRLSLLPASGFQSAQYRMIEIASTELINLVEYPARPELKDAPVEKQYEKLYWKRGATDLTTGHKTLTLRRFEQKYQEKLIGWAQKHEGKNLHTAFLSLSEEERETSGLTEAMKSFDRMVNVTWPMMHLGTAHRYLDSPVTPDEKARGEEQKNSRGATGGTNWKDYLAPKMQRRIFFPELWNEEELQEWGKRP